MMNFEHISAAMPDAEFAELVTAMDDWRATADTPFDAESVGRKLVTSAQLVPMFHIWLGVVEGRDLEDVASNKVGWFDFKAVWRKPEF